MSFLNPRTFLLRSDAAAQLREAGIPVKDSTLENMAAAGEGPPYRIINGRALYLREDLERWLERQVRGPSAA